MKEQKKGEKENKKSDAALREEKILEFWKNNKIFEKSLEKYAPKGEFVFYEGPPTANGKPGIHHLESRSFKDAIPRYKTMRGYHVRRKGGWDTHGLPVELQVEKKLGLNSKKAIEEYGIAKFNQECKESVWEYVDFWDKFTERVGYWVDEKNPYVTYHNDFIESVWSIVKKIDEQELLYKDYKVVPWCPRCGTVLSSHELAQGYENDKDLSVTVKFKIIGQENTYILAWTTTPWTLPGNVALAVGKDIEYQKIELNGEFMILARDVVAQSSFASENPAYKVVQDEIKGSDLVGLEYEPLYPFLADKFKKQDLAAFEKAYKVYTANFVNTEDGTGIVHTAVMYGQDDFVLGAEIGLPKYHLVNENGNFISDMDFLSGKFVKDEETAVLIIKNLANRGLLFRKEKYEHSYPHCWRCHTALIYYARDSWYIQMSDSKIKEQLISENQKINWEPTHIRDGRFGEWLKEIKDWAISRERYWGTPLPVWQCASCSKVHVVGSINELRNKTKKSGNKYFVMRHGESESNIKNGMHGIVSSRADNLDHLTQMGVEDVKKTAEQIRDKNIELIFASPFVRTRDTLDILKKTFKFKDEQIIFDKRLGELDAGDFEGKPWDEYRSMFASEQQRFLEPIHGGESLSDVKRRMGDFIYELEGKYHNKNILIISHGVSLWLLFAVINGYDVDESITMTAGVFRYSEELERGVSAEFKHFANAELREALFVPMPHNGDYELDLHRPYIDEVSLVCSCGGSLARTREVMDVWFDSGAMPFAQDHYPFENKEWVEGSGYPADFISEAIDQTRGWFYTLHAVGVLMGSGLAYKNVICLGHLLDAKGKKMSKSLGNVIDPWLMMDKYGVDTLRLWMYSVNQPGESKNFDEKTVAILHQQVFTLLYNILAFYELYRDKNMEDGQELKSNSILDTWILVRLNELIELMTRNLDNYKLLEPVRAIRDFVGDLSTWYLRRSRERIKGGDETAKRTLYCVLKTISQLMAPFAPFAADDLWLRLKNSEDVESVHLAKWPQFSPVSEGDIKILKEMRVTREICTAGNAERQKLKIPVRQPLNQIVVKWMVSEPYQDIVKDELNVKSIIVKNTVVEFSDFSPVEFDTVITPELKQEGDYRELVRILQDMRKKMKLTPVDVVVLVFDTNDTGRKLIEKFESELQKTVLASRVEFKENDGEEVRIDGLIFKVKIQQ